jgi:hypothetical protein
MQMCRGGAVGEFYDAAFKSESGRVEKWRQAVRPIRIWLEYDDIKTEKSFVIYHRNNITKSIFAKRSCSGIVGNYVKVKR